MVEGALEVLFEVIAEAGGSLIECGLEWLSGDDTKSNDHPFVYPESLYEERPPSPPAAEELN